MAFKSISRLVLNGLSGVMTLGDHKGETEYILEMELICNV